MKGRRKYQASAASTGCRSGAEGRPGSGGSGALRPATGTGRFRTTVRPVLERAADIVLELALVAVAGVSVVATAGIELSVAGAGPLEKWSPRSTPADERSIGLEER